MSNDRFRKFPKIYSYRKAREAAAYHGIRRVNVVGSPKIHGTNACIARVDGEIHFQSRNRCISSENDNAGFARWGEGLPVEALSALFYNFKTNQDVWLYGEWAGPGIQKGTAINDLDGKKFIAFSVATRSRRLMAHEALVAGGLEEFDIHVIQASDLTPVVEVDYDDPELPAAITEATALAGEQCPYAKRLGLEGIGEGYVWVPLDYEVRRITDLWFKTKAEAFLAKSGECRPKKPKNKGNQAAYQFAREATHEARLAKGLEALDGPPTREDTGTFIQWVQGDILDELSVEIEEAGLSPGEVSRAVGKFAAPWYLRRAQ